MALYLSSIRISLSFIDDVHGVRLKPPFLFPSTIIHTCNHIFSICWWMHTLSLPNVLVVMCTNTMFAPMYTYMIRHFSFTKSITTSIRKLSKMEPLEWFWIQCYLYPNSSKMFHSIIIEFIITLVSWFSTWNKTWSFWNPRGIDISYLWCKLETSKLGLFL